MSHNNELRCTYANAASYEAEKKLLFTQRPELGRATALLFSTKQVWSYSTVYADWVKSVHGIWLKVYEVGLYVTCHGVM